MFKHPTRATKHCRHYSYELGLNGKGPLCAKDVFLGNTSPCMPDPPFAPYCSSREEYTEQEHEEWSAWSEDRMQKQNIRFKSIDKPIACNSQIKFDCQCEDSGTIAAARGSKRGYINCSCDLGEIQINIGHVNAWPQTDSQMGGINMFDPTDGCEYCATEPDRGWIEMPNNGPIVPCPICNPMSENELAWENAEKQRENQTTEHRRKAR